MSHFRINKLNIAPQGFKKVYEVRIEVAQSTSDEDGDRIFLGAPCIGPKELEYWKNQLISQIKKLRFPN